MTRGTGGLCPQPQKVSFSTKQAAKREQRRKPWFETYRCRCGSWHLTTKARFKERVA